jgi:hypothetical protein
MNYLFILLTGKEVADFWLRPRKMSDKVPQTVKSSYAEHPVNVLTL